MSKALHFGKAFGICWVALMVAYVFIVFRWGFAVDVTWSRTSRPPMWAVQMVFWLWPVIPAFAVAAIWEVVRIAAFRRN